MVSLQPFFFRYSLGLDCANSLSASLEGVNRKKQLHYCQGSFVFWESVYQSRKLQRTRTALLWVVLVRCQKKVPFLCTHCQHFKVQATNLSLTQFLIPVKPRGRHQKHRPLSCGKHNSRGRLVFTRASHPLCEASVL